MMQVHQPDGVRQRYLTVNEFAKKIGVHPQTVRSWEEAGTCLPHHRTPGGHRRYTDDQVEMILHEQDGDATTEQEGRHGRNEI